MRLLKRERKGRERGKKNIYINGAVPVDDARACLSERHADVVDLNSQMARPIHVLIIVRVTMLYHSCRTGHKDIH